MCNYSFSSGYDCYGIIVFNSFLERYPVTAVIDGRIESVGCSPDPLAINDNKNNCLSNDSDSLNGPSTGEPVQRLKWSRRNKLCSEIPKTVLKC